MRSSWENSSRMRGLAPTRTPNASRSEDASSISPPSISTQLGAAQREQGTAGDRGLDDRDAARQGPVPDAEIADPNAIAGDRQLAVKARDRQIIDDKVVGRVRADRAALGDLGPLCAGGRPRRDQNAKAPDRAALAAVDRIRRGRGGVGHGSTVAEFCVKPRRRPGDRRRATAARR
jgi:hypothetical protein